MVIRVEVSKNKRGTWDAILVGPKKLDLRPYPNTSSTRGMAKNLAMASALATMAFRFTEGKLRRTKRFKFVMVEMPQ
jgi:hypothetical protein